MNIIVFDVEKNKLFQMDKEFRPNEGDVIIYDHQQYRIISISYDVIEDYLQVMVDEEYGDK